MLHWLYDPHRKLKRFVEENIKAKAEPIRHPYVLHIMEMAKENGMRPSDVNSLAEELIPENLTPPANEHERYELMRYIMEILLDDLNFDDAEKDFLKCFAVEIGYPIERVAFVIREIYNGMKNENSETEIVEAVEEALAA